MHVLVLIVYLNLHDSAMAFNNSSSNGQSSVSHFPFRLWELIAFTIISFFGVCGNSAVIFAVNTIKRQGNPDFTTPFNIYLAALATADLLVTLLGPIYYILLTPKLYPTSTILGTIQCKFVHSFPLWMVMWSCYMLVAISIERYVAIRFPLSIKMTASDVPAIKVSIVSCILALVTTIPNIYGGKFVESGFGTSGDFCTYEWDSTRLQHSIYAVQFCIQTIIPLLIFTSVFVAIWKHLTMRTVTLQDLYGLSLSPDALKLVLHQRARSAKSVGIIIAAFFICWMPDRILFFLFQFLDIKLIDWNSAVYQIFLLLIFFSSSLNPFIIAFRSEKFRLVLKKAICKKLKLNDHVDHVRFPESNKV